MTKEEYLEAAHDFIASFLDETCDDTGAVTASIKGTICQFIQTTRSDICRLARKNGGWVTNEQILQTQIDNLRRCVVDLQRCLITKEETLQ